MKAWGESLKANNITLVADWDGSFTKLVDKEIDLSAAGLGKRCKRYSLIIDNGKIVKENVESAPNECVCPHSPFGLLTSNHSRVFSPLLATQPQAYRCCHRLGPDLRDRGKAAGNECTTIDGLLPPFRSNSFVFFLLFFVLSMC